MNRKSNTKWLHYAFSGIGLFCLAVYSFDILAGDGDGIIARFSLNPLSIFLSSALVWGLLCGMQSRKAWLVNLSLSLFSFLSILFIIEKLLPYIATYQAGVHESIQPVDQIFPYTSLDTVFFKNYRPNCSFHTMARPVDGGRRILHKINSDGMRGPEIPAKHKNEQRILLIGDSYIQATQVAYEETVGAILDSLLSDSFSVIQHGFPSWSPLLEWNWILRKGLSFKPDKVVLFLYANDFYSGDAVGDSGYLPYTQFDQKGQPASFDFSHLEELPPGTNRNPWTLMTQGLQQMRLVRMTSYFIRRNRARRTLAEEQLSKYLEMDADAYAQAYQNENKTKDILTVALWDYLELMRDTSLWGAAVKERVALSFQHIDGLRQSLAEHNIPLFVCLIPYPWQFPGENMVRKSEVAGWSDYVFPEGGLPQAIVSFCQSTGIPVLDLYPVTLRRKKLHPEIDLYFPSDPHWTREGHQMAAQALVEFLHQQEQLKSKQ